MKIEHIFIDTDEHLNQILIEGSLEPSDWEDEHGYGWYDIQDRKSKVLEEGDSYTIEYTEDDIIYVVTIGKKDMVEVLVRAKDHHPYIDTQEMNELVWETIDRIKG